MMLKEIFKIFLKEFEKIKYIVIFVIRGKCIIELSLGYWIEFIELKVIILLKV